MSRTLRRPWIALVLVTGLGIAAHITLAPSIAQETAPTQSPEQIRTRPLPVPVQPPAPAAGDRALPINLATALQLANSRPLDIAVASEQIRLALAQLDRAKVLWLPTLLMGTDYYRHDGRIQETAGTLFDTSRSSFFVGAGPIAVFAVTDAIFEPLAARQVVRARQADLQTATNDSFLAVAEAYFNVQQARGELAGAEDVVRRAEDLANKVKQLSSPPVEIVAPSELVRARAELARRRQTVQKAREQWHVASAELARVLRLEATSLVEPLEPPHMRVTLIGLDQPLDDLIPVGLTNRPELAAQQALVQATLQRLRQERLRPLVPSVLLRGSSTNVTGTLAGGVFGGGRNESMSNFAARSDFDIQVLWEVQNLGLGNRARIRERQAAHQLSVLDLFRIQDRVAAEVAQAYAETQSAAARIPDAENELKDAAESVAKNFEGMRQPKGGGNEVTLVNRPQEVVAAIQALAQAYTDYFGALGDYNRAQFRLYRALGHPAQFVRDQFPSGPALPAPCPPSAAKAPCPSRISNPPTNR